MSYSFMFWEEDQAADLRDNVWHTRLGLEWIDTDRSKFKEKYSLVYHIFHTAVLLLYNYKIYITGG